MDKQLSPQTENTLRELAREISVAHDLDQGIQEELYGHMEDKALSYLSGEECVSEADIVLLTREHFGDRQNLKEFLSRVHQGEATASLARRLAAVIVASLGVAAAVGAIRFVLAGSLAWHIPYYPLSLNAMILDTFGPQVMGFVALFVILKHWQRKLDRNEDVWFTACAGDRLFAMVIGLLFLCWCVPMVRVGFISSLAPPFGAITNVRVLAHNLLATACVFVTPVIWVWWSDRRPRRIQSILTTIAAYFGYGIITGYRWLVGVPRIEISDYGSKLTLIHHPILGETSVGPVAAVMDLLFGSSVTTGIALGGAIVLYAAMRLTQNGYSLYLQGGWRAKPWKGD